MDIPDTTMTVLVAVVFLILGGFLGLALTRVQRSRRLKKQFGSEYQRMIDEIGDKRQAEKELEDRIARVNTLNIRPLTSEEVNRYASEWQKTQREFVDQPLAALQKADRLIQEVMKAKGYPVEDFEQRAADISVDYPELVTDYRGMHQIATKQAGEKVDTEDIRQAMVHGRALFDRLIKHQPDEEDVTQKEKME
jgi:hypothetical protein